MKKTLFLAGLLVLATILNWMANTASNLAHAASYVATHPLETITQYFKDLWTSLTSIFA